ncbi:extracellular solute-binding protein [Micromonospora sp. NPDC049114]|uniref:ABC transporter substrate-binding protein n=1 Tax=unclassified Micromonospora TaxID=2617518 RepID=UPI0033C8E0E1
MKSLPSVKSALSAAAVLLALGACAPGSSSSDEPAADANTAVQTGVPSGPVELNLIATPESGAAMKDIIPAFQAKHPNVKINYVDTTYDDYNKSLNLALSSDTSPDIVLLNAVGTTVKDQLILNLQPYAKAYGWETAYPAGQLNQWRVAKDGTTLGSGDLYAAPASFSQVGLYYNKAKLKKLGIAAAPASLEDLEAALAKAKAGGETPLQLGNKEGHASFPIQLIGQSTDGPAAYAKWVFGEGGATFDTAGNAKGAQSITDWGTKGYYSKDANGIDLQGAVDKFTKGDGVFFVDGSWDSKKIGDALRGDAGFVAFPGPKATAIGTSVAYGISRKSKNAQAAAAFLDFLRSPEAAKASFAQGFLPSDTSTVTAEPGTISADLIAAWNKVNADDGLIGFNNNATATMNDTLVAETQKLIAGKVDPATFIRAVQSDWSKTHG